MHAFVQHNICPYRFASVWMRNTNHCCLINAGMCQQHLLDLCWIHIESTHDDEIFQAIDKE